ncbi:hypothetical protein P154DRAFT_580908 [Amniculicola lignicola CBS 123094]|uniref:Uncharacterized protein n=1 Tax=Amniculicola lignicola CBS 123094 TaxID=1392246 RepID=A0A6A5W2S2_9PLEO|nr:hypothetical protein P154DRAFT_580908 [Amniculicola lignicola CBS 123094]
MKLSTLFITAMVGLATAAPGIPDSLPHNGAEDVDKRQVNGVPSGNCEKCTKFFNDCYHGCWWDPNCTNICLCKTSGYSNCKPQCGYNRC